MVQHLVILSAASEGEETPRVPGFASSRYMLSLALFLACIPTMVGYFLGGFGPLHEALALQRPQASSVP